MTPARFYGDQGRPRAPSRGGQVEPMGSRGVAKGGPKDALVGPGRAKSAHGSECPGKGQGAHFFGESFGTPFGLHFCSRSGLFFIKKSTGFQVPKWIKNGSQNDAIFDPNSALFSKNNCIPIFEAILTRFWKPFWSKFASEIMPESEKASKNGARGQSEKPRRPQ